MVAIKISIRKKMWWLYILVGLFLPMQLPAQVPPGFAKGHRLKRVHRLKPVALPPDGLVPFQSDIAWGLSDTLGNLRVRTIFMDEVFFANGNFALTEFTNIDDQYYGPVKRWWAERNEDAEVWLNADGQYLVVPADYAAYRQADGSLVAKQLRQHLAEPLYQYELDLNGQPDTPVRRWQWWNEQRGYVRYLGSNLLAVKGPSKRRYFRKTDRLNHRYPVQHPPPAMGPPQALYTTAGHRLTPYRYERLSNLQDGRTRYRLAAHSRTYGYLNRQGKEVLSGFTSADPFLYNRAVVTLPKTDRQSAYLYALIDTTGAFIIPPQASRLYGPDSAGFVRRAVSRADGRELQEYLRLDGKPAFPGRLFGWGEEFKGPNAQVNDSIGRPGVLHLDGSWHPRVGVATEPKRSMALPSQIVAIDSSHFQLHTTAGTPLTDKTYSWAQSLAGGWFTVRVATDTPVLLVSPQGKTVPLPVGYTPDMHRHGPQELQEEPFAHGLLKVNWNETWKGRIVKREAYMTRSGRILMHDIE